MRCIVDATCLHAPLTGVGYYAYHLLERLAAKNPAIDFDYFLGTKWSKTLPAALPFRAPSRLESVIRRIPGSRTVWRYVRKHSSGWRKEPPSRSVCLAPNFKPCREWHPCVPIVHDIFFLKRPEDHPGARLQWISDLGVYLEKAPLIIAVSQFTRNETATAYGLDPKKIHVAYPGVHPVFPTRGHEQQQAVLSGYGLSTGSYFLNVATLEPRKNHRTLIAAYARLPRTMRRSHPLVLAGVKGWGDWGEGRVWKNLLAEDQLRVLGYVPSEHLPILYRNATAFCYPSLYEGFGMPLIEAMSCGTPVISSNTSGMLEAVGHGGVLLPPCEKEAWTRSMEELASDPRQREVLGAAGKARATEFTWDKTAAVVGEALISVWEAMA